MPSTRLRGRGGVLGHLGTNPAKKFTSLIQSISEPERPQSVRSVLDPRPDPRNSISEWERLGVKGGSILRTVLCYPWFRNPPCVSLSPDPPENSSRLVSIRTGLGRTPRVEDKEGYTLSLTGAQARRRADIRDPGAPRLWGAGRLACVPGFADRLSRVLCG